MFLKITGGIALVGLGFTLIWFSLNRLEKSIRGIILLLLLLGIILAGGGFSLLF